MDDSNFSVDYDVSPDEISDILNTSYVDASLDPVVVASDEAASVEISAETESSPEQEASREEESFLSVSGGDAAASPFSEPVQVVLVESPELMEKLDTLKEGDVLFLAGSIPSSMPDDMYEKIMARLDGRGVMIVVDATRDLLVNVLKYHPFLVKPNNHELGEIFGVELKTRQDVIPYGKKLQEKGARNVLISMAGEGAVLVAENGQVFEKPAPKGTLVNGVGAGDSMVAGFMAGWMEKQDHEYAFHMGISAGSASAFSENLATREEVQAVYEQVTEG